MLRKQSGFAAAAILSLALGIGAISAIFALVDVTRLRPLPFPDPERPVMLWERREPSECDCDGSPFMRRRFRWAGGRRWLP
jgi:putative ABC transport system permease protein